LPSARDNRPLKSTEFEEKIKARIYVSATPGSRELVRCFDDSLPKTEDPFGQYHVVQQLIRPTGLVDPEVLIHPTKGQIEHLLLEINERIARSERVLITALTKQNAEEISDYFFKKGIKVQYLHSDIHSLDRVDILHDLRLGKYDVLVGVNLLREGLDLPEVSLVAILDADKEGFLRNERSLIQIMGRAARNLNGRVILYADKMTDSIQNAMQEANRRRTIQLAYNEKHGITPQTTVREITDIRPDGRKATQVLLEEISLSDSVTSLPQKLAALEKQMQEAADRLEFELAAVIRDQIEELKNAA
jgi:excinuclease ABC subunit B